MEGTDCEILLVEDNWYDAQVAIRTLKQQELVSKLLWVENGEEAMDFFQATGKFSGRDLTQKPKMVFLDIKLPRMDGNEILQFIRLHHNLQNIPVVVMTASIEETERYRSKLLGVNAFMIKPIKHKNLIEIMIDIQLYDYFFNNPKALTS